MVYAWRPGGSWSAVSVAGSPRDLGLTTVERLPSVVIHLRSRSLNLESASDALLLPFGRTAWA